ncbi:Potassium transporter 2 isoform 1 [Hibiscus syriacus]|uniref:Potassium transporter 2 isoform 1 n=1 Tax=Hibiscus syriacus TaxID=106335 RepID=A0A6A3CY05_HIBSY|nr:Potassium transporter 2 isoform 1 [Hibiscus syriacus]
MLLLTSSSRRLAEATGRLSSPAKTRTRELLEMEHDYPGDVPSIPSDYDYNDFYRRQGDVPSPGIGH